MSKYILFKKDDELKIGDLVFKSEGFEKIIKQNKNMYILNSGNIISNEEMIIRTQKIKECLKKYEKDITAKDLITWSGCVTDKTFMSLFCTDDRFLEFKKIIDDIINMKYMFMFELDSYYVCEVLFNNKKYYSAIAKKDAEIDNSKKLIFKNTKQRNKIYTKLSEVILIIEDFNEVEV